MDSQGKSMKEINYLKKIKIRYRGKQPYLRKIASSKEFSQCLIEYIIEKILFYRELLNHKEKSMRLSFSRRKHIQI